MNSQNAGLVSTIAERQQEVNDLKHKLDEATVELKKEMELSAKRQSDVNSLQQNVADMKSQHELTQQKLRDTEATVLKLKVEFCRYNST